MFPHMTLREEQRERREQSHNHDHDIIAMRLEFRIWRWSGGALLLFLILILILTCVYEGRTRKWEMQYKHDIRLCIPCCLHGLGLFFRREDDISRGVDALSGERARE